MGAAHARPQPPQCKGDVLMLVSQPLGVFPSQSPKPTAQRSWHVPVVHAALWLAPAAHVRPQPPQCARLVRVSTSQPLALLPSQFAKPALQVIVQLELAQVGAAFGALGQTFAHAPQLFALLVVSMHTPLQRIVGAMQLTEHVPIEQLCPAGHALPQAPQWLLLVCGSTHAPAQNN
jgi:hypothetical protein